jgi:eukaryotic-like serine/threonine-protein kinase
LHFYMSSPRWRSGSTHGTPYLVMEYLEGETLAARLKRGPLPPNHALEYALQIADALDKAHRHG